MVCRVAGLLNDFAYGLAHVTKCICHFAEFVCAVNVKQTGKTEVTALEQFQSFNHVFKRSGDGFGNGEAEENQDDKRDAESNEQVANRRVNAFVTAFNRVVRILISLLLNCQNRITGRNGEGHDITLIEIQRIGSVSCDCLYIGVDGRTHGEHFVAAGFELRPFAFCRVNLSTSLRVIFDDFFVESQGLVKFFYRVFVLGLT